MNPQSDIPKLNIGPGNFQSAKACTVAMDMVPTGRGTWVRQSEISLDELLRRFDLAFPEHVVMSRSEVVEAYRKAESNSIKGFPTNIWRSCHDRHRS